MTMSRPTTPLTAVLCSGCGDGVVDAGCRVCGRTGMASVLCLGKTPLANEFRPAGSTPSSRYPLHVVHCESCRLTQLARGVSPELLFAEYAYFSSASRPVVEHGDELRRFTRRRCRVPAGGLVIDIGSNDGYLLRGYARDGHRLLGVDPAGNVTAQAAAQGIETLTAYFSSATAELIRRDRGAADVIHANNVLAHVPDVLDFLRGCRILLQREGHLVIEVPYVVDLVAKGHFDTIYHEHVFYFSFTSLTRLLESAGLCPVYVERIGFHGGSLRVVARAGAAPVDPSVPRLLGLEEAERVGEAGFYRVFAGEVHRFLQATREEIEPLAASGRRLAGYGAPAKAAIMMAAAELPLAFICDSTPYKQNKLLPGTGIPIAGPERFESDPTDYCIIFAWNYADSIIAANRAYLQRGGTFIKPADWKLEYITAASSSRG